MDIAGLKYGFPTRFCRDQAFFDKTEGWPLWVLSQNMIFFKTSKKIVYNTIMSNLARIWANPFAF
jgi:hypothetical protein